MYCNEYLEPFFRQEGVEGKEEEEKPNFLFG